MIKEQFPQLYRMMVIRRFGFRFWPCSPIVELYEPGADEWFSYVVLPMPR